MPGIHVDLTALKLAYLNNEGSVLSLAKRFGVSHYTVRHRARKEGWTALALRNGDKVAQASKQTAVVMGTLASANALRFLERSEREALTWMDRIQRAAGDPYKALDPETMRKLIDCWERVVKVMRQTYQLDAPAGDGPRSLVTLSTVRGALGDAQVVDVDPQVGIHPTTDAPIPQQKPPSEG